ncbi:hypothetical protein IKX64_02010 [Candidatus Saccharibacteria bacterium]|nr:hypothetical protein [Candidatus Saccharibacteria bacterium]
MSDLKSGKVRIEQLEKVLIRRERHCYYGREYVYYDAFSIQEASDLLASLDILRYINAERINCSHIRKDDPRKEAMEESIANGKVLMRANDIFVEDNDARQFNLGMRIMLLFAYFYRKDSDADHAITEVKRFVENPPESDREQCFENYICNLLKS